MACRARPFAQSKAQVQQRNNTEMCQQGTVPLFFRRMGKHTIVQHLRCDTMCYQTRRSYDKAIDNNNHTGFRSSKDRADQHRNLESTIRGKNGFWCIVNLVSAQGLLQHGKLRRDPIVIETGPGTYTVLQWKPSQGMHNQCSRGRVPNTHLP